MSSNAIKLLYIMLVFSGCGKVNHVTAVKVVPAHSTTAQVYTGSCPSTFNDNYQYDEVTWSNGDVGCETAHLFKVGDTADFQDAH